MAQRGSRSGGSGRRDEGRGSGARFGGGRGGDDRGTRGGRADGGRSFDRGGGRDGGGRSFERSGGRDSGGRGRDGGRDASRGDGGRERADSGPVGGRNERYVFGVNPVLEALRARPENVEGIYIAEGQLQRGAAAELFSRASDAGVRVQKVPRDRLAVMADGGVHQGVVAEVRAFDYLELHELVERAKASDRPPLLVALDGVQDPQNLGAIIRSAHALGAHGVIIPKDRAAQVTGTVAKASAGAIEHTPIARVTNLSRALEELKQAGLWVVAADPEGDTSLYAANLDGPLVVVVGAEGPGVRKGVLEHCDFRLKIPMLGEVASLNASVSAAVLLYEIARQRAGGTRAK